MAIASVNPAAGERIRSFEPFREHQIAEKLELAARAFQSYRRLSFAERSRMMLHAAELLDAEKIKFGRLMTMEMGKPIQAAVEEAAKCARGCRYYAELAERQLQEVLVQVDDAHAFIRHQPLGPLLAIMPWNFPFWQVFRFAAPALMAGNVALLR